MADPDSVFFFIGYFFAQQGQSASFQPFLYENAGYQKSGKRRKQEAVDQQPAAEAGFYRRSRVVGIGLRCHHGHSQLRITQSGTGCSS